MSEDLELLILEVWPCAGLTRVSVARLRSVPTASTTVVVFTTSEWPCNNYLDGGAELARV